MTGSSYTKTVSATTSASLTGCTITYHITVTGPCSSLISLSGNTLTFAASDVLAYAGTCYVAVKASIGEVTPTVWSAATTGTFIYVDPCLTAKMLGSCWGPLTVNLYAVNSVSVGYWSDNVTSAIHNGTQICSYTTFS